MLKDLTFKILEYLVTNNNDFNFVDIKNPFLEDLITQEQRNIYRRVLKALKKNGLIVITDDYIRINAVIAGPDTLEISETYATDYLNAVNTVQRIPYPIDKLNISASITKAGFDYYHVLKSQLKNSINLDGSLNFPLNSEIKTFKSLFKKPSIYEDLIDFMAKENLVLKVNNKVLWRGIKTNRKFEIASFYCALYLSTDFLNVKDRILDHKLCDIASSTFFDFKISYKTIRNKGHINLIESYNQMLERFRAG